MKAVILEDVEADDNELRVEFIDPYEVMLVIKQCDTQKTLGVVVVSLTELLFSISAAQPRVQLTGATDSNSSGDEIPAPATDA